MATHSVTLTAEQEAALPLRDKETVAEFAQRHLDSVANVAVGQDRQRSFDALTDAKKDVAIAAGKA